MNPSLQQQQEAFKKAMQRAPIIQRHQTIPLSVPVAPASPTPSTTSSSRPLNSYVHAVITYLKKLERPASIAEIYKDLNLNLSAQPELLDKIQRSERIYFDGQSLCYQSVFAIKDKEDVIKTLEQRPNLAGIELSELKEAHPKVEDMVMELVRQKRAFLLRLRDDGPKVVFLNDFKSPAKQVDEYFKLLWSTTLIPSSEAELIMALERSGLKSHTHAASSLSQQAHPGGTLSASNKRKATSKRPFRRIKITNDYLEGIDLNIDPGT